MALSPPNARSARLCARMPAAIATANSIVIHATVIHCRRITLSFCVVTCITLQNTKAPEFPGLRWVTDESASLCLFDLAALDAGRADPQTLGRAVDFCLHRTKVDVPAPLGDVV